MARYEDAHLNRLRVGANPTDGRGLDLLNVPTHATAVVGAEAADVINVAIQLYSMTGRALEVAGQVKLALASDADGLNFAGTDANLSAAIGTDGSLLEVVTDQLYEAISEADGDLDIDFTKTDAGTKYLVLVFPWGNRQVIGPLTWT